MSRPALLLILALGLVLAACVGAPPRVNPLTDRQIAALKVSSVQFDATDLAHPTPTVTFLTEAVRKRYIARLGERYTPGAGGAVVTLKIHKLLLVGPALAPDAVQLDLESAVTGPDYVAHYLISSGYVGRVQTSTGEIEPSARLPMAAETAADFAYNVMTQNAAMFLAPGAYCDTRPRKSVCKRLRVNAL